MNADQLEQRRRDILHQLEDPKFDGDVEALFKEATELRGQITSYNDRANQAAELRAQLGNVSVATARRLGTEPTQPLGQVETPERQGSWGQQFIAADIAKRYGAHGAKGASEALEYPGGFDDGMSMRALLAGGDGVYTGTNAGAFQRPPLQPWIALLNPDRLPRILEIIDRGNTDNSSVDYVQDTSAAGGIGGLAAEALEGVVKPEAVASFTQKTAPVRTISHYIPITRQALDDNPMLRSYIDGRLRYGLLRRIDNQLVNGNGTGANLTGILNVSGIGTYAPGSAEARLISIRKGRTIAELSELSPEVLIVNPSDWEKVDLLVSSGSGEFMAGPGGQLLTGAGVAGQPQGSESIGDRYPAVNPRLSRTLWGLVVIPTTAIAAGTALLGNFSEAATLWDRQQTQVLISDSHADFFVRNQLALLAEARVALTVQQPLAFVKITFNGTT